MTAHPDQRYGSVTFAQHGEDIMILNLITLLDLRAKFSWLDLGCNHPTNISNTKLFYNLGYRGVNIDANQNVIDLFKIERPEDRNVCVGVAAESGLRDFYMYDDFSGRNTFSVEEAKTFKEKEIVTVKRLTVVTINQIIDQDCGGTFPLLLSVDLEGLDYEVLKGADFRASKPTIVVVETRHNTKATEKMVDLFLSRNYVWVCRMGENMIFLDGAYYEAYIFGPK